MVVVSIFKTSASSHRLATRPAPHLLDILRLPDYQMNQPSVLLRRRWTFAEIQRACPPSKRLDQTLARIAALAWPPAVLIGSNDRIASATSRCAS